MDISNRVYNNMSIKEMRARYDASCKAVLSYKSFLAYILKGCVEEYKNEDPKYIEELIEGEPLVSEVPVHRDEEVSPKIIGMNNEDSSVTEGTAYYDILFYAYTPDKKDKVKLIINIEAQNSFHPGYPLIRRALYYCSRLISSQKGREFTKQNYGDIKKVISIWICSNPPQKNKNTLTRFSVAKTHLIGEAKYNFKDYDIFDVIMVCLDMQAIKNGKFQTDDGNFREVIKFLTYLLTSALNNEEKKEIFKTEYNISMSENIKKEVANMCNLSYGLVSESIAEGIAAGEEKGRIMGIAEGKASNAIKSVKMLMKNLGLSLTDTLNALGITEEEYNNYMIIAGVNNP